MPLLEIRDLTVAFPQADGVVQAVRGASFAVEPGESVGIVGESGSGKSVTCMAALRLLREPPAKVKATRLMLDGVDMLRASRRDLADMRGRVAAMVFQDPMTAFDPVYTIGRQIAETVEAHRGLSRGRRRWPRRGRCSRGWRYGTRTRWWRPIRTSCRGHVAAGDDRDGAVVPAETADRG